MRFAYKQSPCSFAHLKNVSARTSTSSRSKKLTVSLTKLKESSQQNKKPCLKLTRQTKINLKNKSSNNSPSFFKQFTNLCLGQSILNNCNSNEKNDQIEFVDYSNQIQDVPHLSRDFRHIKYQNNRNQIKFQQNKKPDVPVSPQTPINKIIQLEQCLTQQKYGQISKEQETRESKNSEENMLGIQTMTASKNSTDFFRANSKMI